MNHKVDVSVDHLTVVDLNLPNSLHQRSWPQQPDDILAPFCAYFPSLFLSAVSGGKTKVCFDKHRDQ
jgi:hypothetical protein